MSTTTRGIRRRSLLLEKLDKFLAANDRDINPAVKGSGRMRVGMGIYYFEEDFSENIAEVPVEKITSWGSNKKLKVNWFHIGDGSIKKDIMRILFSVLFIGLAVSTTFFYSCGSNVTPSLSC